MMSRMYSSLKENLALTLVCVAFAAGLVYFAARPHVAPDEQSFFSLFSLPLQDYQGKTVRLSTFETKPIVVYLWASWCPFCQAGFRDLSQAQQQHPDIAFVAINRGEPFADAKGFTDKMLLPSGIAYLLDPSDSFYKAVGGFAMPEYLFVDRHSTIVEHARGPLTAQQLQTELERLLR